MTKGLIVWFSIEKMKKKNVFLPFFFVFAQKLCKHTLNNKHPKKKNRSTDQYLFEFNRMAQFQPIN